MKNARQQKMLEIIELYDVDTQETMITLLNEAGFNVTQTTVSRDIRQLGLVKAISKNGVYKYVAPSVGIRGESSAPVLNSAINDAVIKITPAGNIVVIKTYAGMANAIAVCVDSMYHDKIVGSVAGDDTILLVVYSAEIALNFADELKANFLKK